MGWIGVGMAVISFFLLLGTWANTRDMSESLEHIEKLLVELHQERQSNKSEP